MLTGEPSTPRNQNLSNYVLIPNHSGSRKEFPMADNDTKLVQILVLANVRATDDNQARTVGGTLARQIQASISDQYEVLGVELQSVGSPDDQKRATKAREDNTPASKLIT